MQFTFFEETVLRFLFLIISILIMVTILFLTLISIGVIDNQQKIKKKLKELEKKKEDNSFLK